MNIDNETKTRSRVHLGLLPRVIIAIILGVACGVFFPVPLVRAFITFNSLFSQFLDFMIPLIIIGLVTPAIADIGRGAGRLLMVTVVIAYADTVAAALLAYGTGSCLFPSMIASTSGIPHVAKAAEPLTILRHQHPGNGGRDERSRFLIRHGTGHRLRQPEHYQACLR